MARLEAATCRNSQLLVRLAKKQGKTPPVLEDCKFTATRHVTVGNRGVDLCLWHSLVATERIGARLVAVVDPVRT